MKAKLFINKMKKKKYQTVGIIQNLIEKLKKHNHVCGVTIIKNLLGWGVYSFFVK